MNDIKVRTSENMAKNREIVHYKVVNTSLIILSLLVSAALFFSIMINQVTSLITNSNIKVVENVKITVPKNITEGQVFKYHTEGTKLIEAPADIRLQMACKVDGAENIITVATYASDNPKGKWSKDRLSAIPPSSKLASSDNCKFQFISTYTIYQRTNNGTIRTIPVVDITESNQFTFTAKADVE